MIAPADEVLRPSTGPGFSDGVEIAFGDGAAGVFVTARLGIVPGPPATGTALLVVFRGGEPVSVVAQGGVEVTEPDWAGVEVAGLRFEMLEPLVCWRAVYAGERASFDVVIDAISAPCEAAPDSEVVRAGGRPGYEQICRVTGTATIDGRAHEIACLGQRGHSWGEADWDRIESARSVAAWLEDGQAVALSAIRPAGAHGHDEDASIAWLVPAPVEGAASAGIELDEPRLSTGYDAGGRQLRAALELWETEDTDIPRRASGQAVCGTTLDLGPFRLDCAFFAWRMEGRSGLGRYDLFRRA